MDSIANLNIAKTELAPCLYSLRLEVAPERVKKAVRTVIGEFSTQVRIPGFRAGKVPANVILSRFKPDVIAEAQRRVMDAALSDAVKAEQLSVLSNPELKDAATLELEPTAPFAFTVEVETKPVFTLPEYKGIALTKKKVTVPSERVEEIMNSLKERNITYNKTEEAARAADMVRADYTATVPEGMETTDRSKYVLNGTNSWLVLKEPEMLPGMTAILEGVKAGEEREGVITFPESHYNKEVAGKSLTYHFKVNEVHAASIPELDDALAKTVGAESVEDLRKRVEENLKNQLERAEKEKMSNELVEKLGAMVDFPLPPKMLEKEIDGYLKRTEKAPADGEKAPEETDEQKKQKREDAKKNIEKSMRMSFLVEALCEAEKIEVQPKDVYSVVAEYAQMENTTLDAMLRKMRDNDQLMRLYSSLRYTKMMDRLLELASVTETE